MTPLRCYYAHCVAIYESPQEERDIDRLLTLGFDVINPNSPYFGDRCAEIKRIFSVAYAQDYLDAGEAIMDLVFKPLFDGLDSAMDLVAFRALPDGRIPSGVARELLWARLAGIPVIELPSNVSERGMTVDSTREYLREVGYR